MDYSEHDVGYGGPATLEATEKQYNFIGRLGMDIKKTISKKQAGRIIDQLLSGETPEQVAATNRVGDDWKPQGPSSKQQYLMRKRGLPEARTSFEASNMIDACLNPEQFFDKALAKIEESATAKQLTQTAHVIGSVKGILDDLLLPGS